MKIEGKRYAVIGNPIAHSRSPEIHELFGQQTGIALHYERLLAPPADCQRVIEAFFEGGGHGLNVTLPFKEQAYKLARAHLDTRAQAALAVNTLWMQDGDLHGSNTDGLGLLQDLIRLGFPPTNRRILLIGAGGAARGVVLPLLQASCHYLRIINRTADRAAQLAAHVATLVPDAARGLDHGGLDHTEGVWDIVINASASSLGNTPLVLPGLVYRPDTLAYDMAYGAQTTSFLQNAQDQDVGHIADGLGMLVGQAAASFAIWHGVTPEIEPVLHALRTRLLA
ncbi:shikimate dehydrogenase [Alcaligenaceae bacterium CGII-47]|nr:shikimate dehydrogenase [Alcaligenaceae bacterium CGII-47]